MDSKTFLQRVLSGDGYYSLFAAKGVRKEDPHTQRFYETLEELIQESTDLDQAGYNVFYALGTFNEWG